MTSRGRPRRFFIGVAATTWPTAPDLESRPELATELERMRELFGQTFGYEIVEDFGVDLTSTAFRGGLSRFLTDDSRRSDDHVVVYYTGHADATGGDLVLPFADATEDLVRTGVGPAELGRWVLSGTVVERMALILDTCYGGAAGQAIATRAADRVGAARGQAAPSVVLVVASRPHESAGSGEFTRAFERATLSPSTGGIEPAFLHFDALVGVVNADKATPGWQHASHFSFGEAIGEFLPNPRHRDDLGRRELMMITERQEDMRTADLRSHFHPRARGLDTPDLDAWLFTGRHAALRSLSAWLSADDRSSRVVTGSPGSGKSSVIARLGVLARPDHRQLVPGLHEFPPDTVPPLGCVDVLIHARRRSADQVLEALVAASGVTAGDTTEWTAKMAARGRSMVVAIDAVDESSEPQQLARMVLRPILQAPECRVRLLLGVRKTVLGSLGDAPVLDLDEPAYADPDALRRYSERCLRELAGDSPYADLRQATVAKVARAVAEAAGHSFLVALVYSRSLALRDHPVDPRDQAWQDALPRQASEAMRRDLDERLGADAGRAADLLRALGYARGSGLPWEDVWGRVASRLAGRVYATDDLLWLRERAGFYVIEDLQDGRSVYRLYHQALADHLLAGRDAVEDERRFADALVELVPSVDGWRDFGRAHPYTRTHLASHAAAAGRIDDLVLTPTFLLASDRRRLLAALPTARGREAVMAANAFRRAVPGILASPDPDHISYLEHSAAVHGPSALFARCRDWPGARAWQTRWARTYSSTVSGPARGHQDQVNAVAALPRSEGLEVWSGSDDGVVLRWEDAGTVGPIASGWRAHDAPVRSLAVALVDGERILVSAGNDGEVATWSADGELRRRWRAHAGWIRGLTVAGDEPATAIVTGGTDHEIRSWNAASGERSHAVFTGHEGWINSLATSVVGGRRIVVSGSSDGTVRLWDLENGESLAPPFIHDDWVNAVAVTVIGDRDVVLAACSDGLLHIWDIATSSALRDPLRAHRGWVRAVGTAVIDGRPVAITAGADALLRVWGLDDAEPAGAPLEGHTQEIRSVATSTLPDRVVVVSAGADTTVRAWDPKRRVSLGPAMADEQGRSVALAAVRDEGREVLVSGGADGRLAAWSGSDGQPWGGEGTRHGDAARALAAMAIGGGVAVASGGAGHLASWMVTDAAGWEERWRLARPDVSALALATTSERQVLITALGDAGVSLLALDDGAPVGEPLVDSAVTALTVTTVAGRVLVAGGDAAGRLDLWDLETGDRLARCAPSAGRLDALAACSLPDGSGVVVGGGPEGAVTCWLLNAESTRPRARWRKPRAIAASRIGRHPEGIQDVAVSSRFFAAAGGRTLSLRQLGGHPVAGSVIELEAGCHAVTALARGGVAVGGRVVAIIDALPEATAR